MVSPHKPFFASSKLLASFQAISSAMSAGTVAISFLVGGLIISLLVWLIASSNERQIHETKLDRSADVRTILLQNAINADIGLLHSTERFFSNSTFVDASEFQGFLAWKFREKSSILAIDWAPRITQNERKEWERKQNHSIVEFSGGDKAVRDYSSEVYFPVQYSAGVLSTDIIGFDHGSVHDRRQAMDESLRTHSVTNSGPVKLVRETSGPLNNANFLIFVPVEHGEELPENLSSPNLKGFIIGVFQLSKFVEQALSGLQNRTLLIRFTSGDGNVKPFFEFCHAPSEGVCDETVDLSRKRSLSIAGQTWTVEYVATEAFIDEAGLTVAKPILIGCLFVTLIVAICAHLLVRKREELRRSDQRFSDLVDGIREYAIIALDLQGNIVTWNQGAERIKGYSASEILGKHTSIFYEPIAVERGDPDQALEIARREGRFESDGIRVRKDGTKFWANVLVTPMYDMNGVLAGYTKVTKDTTQKKMLEEELTRAKEAAEASTKSKSQFVANVSHEIRTPLTSIIGFTEEMMLRELSKEEQKSQLAVVLRNAKHLLNLINDILDFSKIEAGKLELDFSGVSLRGVIDEISRMMSPRANQKGLTLNFEYITPLPSLVLTDSTRLKQIILNLVDNAIKFTDHGRVDVSLGYDAGTHLLKVTVVDTGIGIPNENRERIFSSFGQGDASINRVYGGTGLGLVISRQLAQRLGGNIVIAESPGNGSTFVLTILAQAVEDHFHSKGSSIPCPDRRDLLSGDRLFKGKILLAEDVSDTQKLLSMILVAQGLDVEVASNGSEAIAKASHQSFDIIFMDMQMPVVDGLAATRALRKKGFYGPIIAFTASGSQSQIEECVNAGCDGCITKPFERATLTGILSLYVPLREDNAHRTVTQDFEFAASEFRRLFGQHLNKLKRSHEREDFTYLRSSAHGLAGAAAFAYPSVCATLRSLENAAENRASRDCSELIESLCRLHQSQVSEGV